MVYKRRRGSKGRGLSRQDWKLLSRAKRARMRQTILNTVRPLVVGPRGGPDSIGAFGPDYKTASDAQRVYRQRWGFAGKGAYSMRKFVRDAGILGEGLKRTYHGWVPKSIRDEISSQALGTVRRGGSLFSGHGEYTANELVAGGAPPMTYGSSGDETEGLIIANREYIQDIFAPSTALFENQIFRLNPGLTSTFPWLSQIACNYEEYEFSKLIFMYRSVVDVGTSTAGQIGTQIMAVNYNPSSQPFDSKDVMMQYHGAVSSKPSDDAVCGVECDPLKNKTLATYIRTTPVSEDEDIKSYDLGVFQLAFNAMPSDFRGKHMGELWVEYECRLRKPKLGSSRGDLIQKDLFVSGLDSTLDTINAPGPDNIIGSMSYLLAGRNNSIGCVLSKSAAGATVITFPNHTSGVFEIVVSCGCRSTMTGLVGNAAFSYGGNVQAYSDMYAGSAASTDAVAERYCYFDTQNKVMSFTCHVRIVPSVGVANTVSITDEFVLTGATTFTQTSITITEMNQKFATSNSDPTPQLIRVINGSSVYL